ncbi:hypothetical protein DFR50_109176 [Roseiarcus fermentans]|uniref:DUF5343 domain-containing protein n=1 Tax=Roseiarcus fermentans TaxID=1473586 RepID=A0A366FIE1_9HYPH|nr:DUF5343 domain-containing protein [Roseiarcus fermentans]RBP14422.1 hypothetical protein DFR50_109176 [Roseiarcus fermentans]
MSRGSSERASLVRTPPYTSYRTFRTFIDDLREQGLPSRVDRSVLTRFSGVVGTQLVHALRFLGLVDGAGRPTQALADLVRAEDEGRWAEALGDLLRKEYAPVFAIDLETATPSHFNEAFRRAFPAADAVVQKCVTFFLYAAGEAGVKVSGRVLKGRKPRSLAPRRKRFAPKVPPPLAATPAEPRPEPPRADDRKPSEFLLTHLEPKEMDAEQLTAVWTLLKYFRARGL